MPNIRLDHFKRAAADVGAHGDNDMLPFDIDNRFVRDNEDVLAEMAFAYSQELARLGHIGAKSAIESLPIFSERLLAPAGAAGFRIATKIHPFWNIYFNGLGIAVGEILEPGRSARAHSYRFATEGIDLFDRTKSWRAFREATIDDCSTQEDEAVDVQTDISSFYEHISHHRLENNINDLFPDDSTVAAQIDRFLSRFASGRSFGLPVGGQCSRILAELLLSQIDQQLTDAKVVWRRYVDDFFLIAPNQSEAYRALSVLANSLANYGLTLNRTKTTLLTVKHYVDYVRTQLGGPTDEATKLHEIDLHFDRYSDTPESDYEELKEIVGSLDIRALLDLELRKAQPDTFLISQIGRTLTLNEPKKSLQLCHTLLSQKNLHAFRASWSTIMRGISTLRANETFSIIFGQLDQLLDNIPTHSPHLLTADASCLHYLRTIRFVRTQRRAEYVFSLYSTTSSQTVKRACIDCWRHWKDRASFTRERNRWDSLRTEEQRMLWLAASDFGDEGEKFRLQVGQSLPHAWRLGVERKRNNERTFESVYTKWGSK